MLLNRDTAGGFISQYSTSSLDDDDDDVNDISGDETLILFLKLCLLYS